MATLTISNIENNHHHKMTVKPLFNNERFNICIRELENGVLVDEYADVDITLTREQARQLLEFLQSRLSFDDC
ncbi:hypothetical protein [Moraxella bovis]|uniref:Uncharacterized protein n=1 Tax=Moraxella bovis TaxID=476 RepID=A0A378PY36_MORBO|nr:hypothetical protein [Moraxella bovis]STY93402.1 Uncharacterised protein [Moraxella bovis]